MNAFSTLPDLIQHIIILVMVVLIKAIIVRFSNDNSMYYFRFYCQRLSNKVNKSRNSNYQQRISGLVALLITLIPLILILWLFEAFVAMNWLWQALLLYFAFGPFDLAATAQQITQALTTKNNQQAKTLLSQQCLRETGALSNLGLCKATIEMQLLKHLQLNVVVAFCFIFVGPIMAIAYRLLLEMHYSWNSKLTAFSHFGQASNLLLQLIMWLPTRIFYLCYLITTLGHNFFIHWRLTRSYFFQLNTNIIIALHAQYLNIQLGGVAMYKQQKLRRLTFNPNGSQPEISDISKANKQLLMANLVIITLLLMIITISYSPLLLNAN